MTQEKFPYRSAARAGRMLANILVTATLAVTPLAITATAASADTRQFAGEQSATAATQAGADRTAPCRRWQNPNAYGHWHCR